MCGSSTTTRIATPATCATRNSRVHERRAGALSTDQLASDPSGLPDALAPEAALAVGGGADPRDRQGRGEGADRDVTGAGGLPRVVDELADMQFVGVYLCRRVFDRRLGEAS